MKDLIQEDLDYARKIVDDIVDNTEIVDIKSKLESNISNYEGNRKRQFLVYINVCFSNVMLNECTWRCNEAYNRAHEARLATIELNDR